MTDLFALIGTEEIDNGCSNYYCCNSCSSCNASYSKETLIAVFTSVEKAKAYIEARKTAAGKKSKSPWEKYFFASSTLYNFCERDLSIEPYFSPEIDPQ